MACSDRVGLGSGALSAVAVQDGGLSQTWVERGRRVQDRRSHGVVGVVGRRVGVARELQV